MIWRNRFGRVGSPCFSIGRQLPVLALLCAAGITFAEVGIQNPAVRPGKNNFGGAVHKHAGFVKRAKEGNCDLLFLGDSITDFWKKTAWNKYFGHLKALNFGISADRTEHVIWRIQNGTLDGIKPRLVVLMIGTNNIKSGDVRVPPRYVLEGVQAIIDEIFKRLPDTKILLMGILPRQPNYDWIADTIKEANVLLKGLAAHDRIWFMDIGDQYLDDNGVLRKELMPDFLHPNEAGYEIWGRSIVGTVHELMGVELPEKFTAPGNYPACSPPIQWCREHNLKWTGKPGDKRLAGLREVAPVRKVKRDGLIYTLDCDGTLEVWGEQDTARIEKMRVWRRRGKKNCGCALWATADHLYARQCGEDSKRVVLTLGRNPKEVWSYSTRGNAAADYIGEFMHVVGDGKALHAFGGATHTEPVAPPPVLEIAPSSTKTRMVDLEMGTAITSWVFTAKSDSVETEPAPITAKGIWSHERFTAGWPAIDLTELHDRTTPTELVLSTTLHVPEATTLRWGLFTPAGEIWNRKDRITAKFHVQKTKVPPNALLQLSPGEYGLTLELKRVKMGGAGKIWIGPHFTAGPSTKELAAAGAQYEANKKHWQEHLNARKEVFVVDLETTASDSNR